MIPNNKVVSTGCKTEGEYGMDRAATWFRKYLGIEELENPIHAPVVRLGFVLAVAAMLIRIVFWVYAQRYWEDALITCLHSENFVRGLGMTHYRPGEPPLHGFTSPLSVLVPLIGDLMHVGFGVDFLKLVSIPAAALTVLYLLGIGIHPAVRLPGPLIGLVMGYAAFEHHQILWGMAGMETQLSALILVMSLYYTIAWKPLALGISLGLCMLVRPDYCFWTMIVGVYALFKEPKRLPLIVGVALAVYLPWIMFTVLYYGSPIPNTVIAKGLGYAKWWEKADVINFFTLKRHTWMMMAEQLHVMLGPVFCGHGAGMHIFFTRAPESLVGNLMFMFSVIGALTVFFRRQWVLWPLIACVVLYSIYYVYMVPVVFGWYKVPYLLILLLVSVRGIQALGTLLPWDKVRVWGMALFSLVYIGLFIAVLPVTFHTERQIQRYVENDVRKAAGLYLKEHMQPDEAVGCEPLGYMGYYSGGNVYDWPGLASRTVVAWSKANPGKRCLEEMLKGLQPEYLFLRDLEVLYFFKDAAWFQEHYRPVARFYVTPEKAKQVRWLDRNIDTDFRIYKKKHPDEPPTVEAVPWPERPQ